MRAKLFKKISKIADTKGTHISAAETSRVASMVLDEIELGMEKLFVGIYWDFTKAAKGDEAVGRKVLKLCDRLKKLVERARRRRKKT